MKEHGGQKGQGRRYSRQRRNAPEMRQFIGDSSHFHHKILDSLGREKLIEEEADIQGNEEDCDEGKA